MNEVLLALLQEVRPEADFDSSTNFVSDALLDSFDVIVLVSALDKKFVVSIAGTDVVPENFETLGSIRRLLAGYGITG